MLLRLPPLCLALATIVASACGGSAVDSPPEKALDSSTGGDSSSAGPEGSIDASVAEADGLIAADVCIPSCDEKQCGSDGCGGDCGVCLGCNGPAPELCLSNGTCAQVCCPLSCEDLKYECGLTSDGCADVLDCGTCLGCEGPDPTLCYQGKCAQVCCPFHCKDLGAVCGVVSDGCGASIDCGTCEGGVCVDNKCQ